MQTIMHSAKPTQWPYHHVHFEKFPWKGWWESKKLLVPRIAKLPSDDILMIATIIQLANWAFFTRGICSWYCTLMMGASSKYWQSKISYSVTIIYMNRAGVPWFEGFGGAHFKFLMWIQLSAEVIWFCLSLLRSIKTFACMFLSFQCDALELCMVVS